MSRRRDLCIVPSLIAAGEDKAVSSLVTPRPFLFGRTNEPGHVRAHLMTWFRWISRILCTLSFLCGLLFHSILIPRLPPPTKVPHTSKGGEPLFRGFREVVEICTNSVRIELLTLLKQQVLLEVFHGGPDRSFGDLPDTWTLCRSILIFILLTVIIIIQPRGPRTGVDVPF